MNGEMRSSLLGHSDRWDDGELAQAIKGGLSLATIETCPTLLTMPWPNHDPSESTSIRAQRYLITLISEGDDQNLKALAILSNTRKSIGTRLCEIAELFGATTSRTGRKRLKHDILPWFLDHLTNRLQAASKHLRASDPRRRDSPPLAPLVDNGSYRAALRRPIDPAEFGEVLKCRLLQIALDVPDLDQAGRLAQIAAIAGADLIEVGDPLIKRHGMQAAARIRRMVPGIPLVVEFSSSDWIDEQVELAVEAGADIVSVLGLDDPRRIERAVRTARRHQVSLTVGLPNHADAHKWCTSAEAAGIDALAIIRNIDSAKGAAHTAQRLVEVAEATNLPVVVSGGFSPANLSEIIDLPWSILIVGGAFVHSPNPTTVVETLLEAINGDQS